MTKKASTSRIELTREAITDAATDPSQIAARVELAEYASKQFAQVGASLHLSGNIIGPDRKASASPFGHGSDETVAVSLLLRITSQLLSASTDLFQDGRSYAAAALVRQMVEVEYLAWAFETRDHDAERWLRSNERERQDFFRPAKLRKAAGERFRGKDYGYHCELGGHPVPMAEILFRDDPTTSQLLLSDLLGHAGRIWDHFVSWARVQKETFILDRAAEMSLKFREWKSKDLLVDLPPPA
jgi:hypothetical protein